MHIYIYILCIYSLLRQEVAAALEQARRGRHLLETRVSLGRLRLRAGDVDARPVREVDAASGGIVGDGGRDGLLTDRV